MRTREIITEFKYGGLTEPDIPVDYILNKKYMNEYEGHSIYHFSWLGHHGLGVFNVDDTYKGYILLKQNNHEFIFSQAFVQSEHRKKGICSSLILFVLRELNHHIIISPDEIITDDSRNLFKTLLKNSKIKMKNTLTGDFVDYKTLSKMFNSIGDNNIGFIVESKKTVTFGSYYEIVNPQTKMAIHESSGTIIRETCWYN